MAATYRANLATLGVTAADLPADLEMKVEDEFAMWVFRCPLRFASARAHAA
jgi:hypothetical protein